MHCTSLRLVVSAWCGRCRWKLNVVCPLNKPTAWAFIAREPLQSLRNHFQTTLHDSRAVDYRPSLKTDSSRSRPAFTDPHRESFGARCPTSQPGTGGITFYTPAKRTRFSPRVVAVEATRRSGMEAHLASLSAGVEEECPRSLRPLAGKAVYPQPFRKGLPNQAFRPWFAWGPRRDRGTRASEPRGLAGRHHAATGQSKCGERRPRR